MPPNPNLPSQSPAFPYIAISIMVVFFAIIGHWTYYHIYEWESKAEFPVLKGVVTPSLPVPDDVPKPSYYKSLVLPPIPPMEIHNSQAIEHMREAGALAAATMDLARRLVEPGISTSVLEMAIHSFIVKHGAYPSPLHYGGFPKSCCTSVNEVAVHGIPDSRPLRDGDIVSVDITVYLNGYHADVAETIAVGNVSVKAQTLMVAAKEAVTAAIAVCKPGVNVKEIGRAIQKSATSNGMGVVTSLSGHGIGTSFHMEPHIPSYVPWFSNEVLHVGQTITIEPVLVEPGGWTHVRMWHDKWTCATGDGSLAAQYEHTILITPEGAEILTADTGRYSF